MLQKYFLCREKYKCKIGKRLIQVYERSSASSSSTSTATSGPKIARPRPPLERMEFVMHTTAFSPKERDELKKTLTRLGGKFVTKVSDKTMAVISTEGLSI